jgi:Tol biopolymer transport system component
LGGDWQLLNLPPHTYSATFAPDGQTIVYAASAGLGLGSEIGSLSLADGSLTPWQTFPDQVVAHPLWSPDGSQLA